MDIAQLNGLANFIWNIADDVHRSHSASGLHNKVADTATATAGFGTAAVGAGRGSVG